MTKKFVALAAFLLTACYNEELYPVPVVPVPPTAPVRPAQPAQRPLSPPANMPMMQDPENVEDWIYEVSVSYSKDAEAMRIAAEKKCRNEIQSDPTSQLLKVEQRTFSPNRNKNVKFLCHFRSEVQTYGDRDRDRN